VSPPDDDAGGGKAAADAAHAARSGAAQLLSIAGQALTPVYSVLAARLFGLAAFGVFQASVAVLDVLSRVGIVGAIGSQHLFIARHRAAGEEDLETRALGTGLRAALGVSTVLALGIALAAGPVARAYGEPPLSVTLPIMAPSILFGALTVTMVASTFGAKVARMSLYVRGIGEPAFLLAACLAAAASGGGVRALAAGYTAASVATATAAVLACSRVFGGRRLWRALRAPRHPDYLRFAVPLAITDVLSALLQRTDIILVTTFAGADEAAVYAASEFIARIVANARYIFDPVAAPVLSEALHTGDRERLTYNLRLMTRWVFTAAAPIAVTVIMLRAPLLKLYGPSFARGASCLAILAVAQLINAAMGLAPYALLMGGRSRLMLVNFCGAAAVNLALGLVLVPRFGIVGAAASVFVSLTALQVAFTLQTWKVAGVNAFSRALLKPAVAAVAALASELVVRAVPLPAAASVAAVVAFALFVYVAVLRALGLPPEERRLWERLTARWRRPARRG
jgi:O-antigen/teichoic acid export membrane protein